MIYFMQIGVADIKEENPRYVGPSIVSTITISKNVTQEELEMAAEAFKKQILPMLRHLKCPREIPE